MNQGALRRAIPTLTIVVAAFLARLFFIVYAPFWAGDSIEYHRIATHLAAGDGYVQFAGSPTVVRPPVYPLFVSGVYALLGAVPGYVLIAQAGIGAVGAGLVYILGRSLFAPRVAFSGALLAGVYPQLAFFSASLLSETLAAALLALTMLLAHHACTRGSPSWSWIASGASAALCVLCTPYLIGVPFAIAGLAIVRQLGTRRLVSGLALAALGFAMVYAPWPIRNEMAFGVPIPLTVGQSGISFWSAASHIPMYDYDGVFVQGARREPLVARWIELYGNGAAREHDTLAERMDLDRRFIAEGLRLIGEDPIGFLAYRARMLPRHWMQPAAFAAEHSFRRPFETQNLDLSSMLSARELGAALVRVTVIVVFTGFFYLALAIGAWGMRRRWRALAVLYLPGLTAILFQAPFWLEFRYSVSSQPFLWLVSAAGLATVIGWIRPRGTPAKDEYLDRAERRPGIDRHAVAE